MAESKSRLLFILLAIVGSTTLSGCATTGATQLVASAKSYEARSLEAIEVLGISLDRELEPIPVPDSEAEAIFVASILGTKHAIEPTVIQTALRPDAHAPSAATEERQQALSALRAQHSQFAAAFDDVERAGLLGKRPVARCAPLIIEKLVARQVYLAKSLGGDGQLRLLGVRDTLVTRIAAVKNSGADEATKRAKLIALRRDWLAMEVEEQKLNADMITSLMKAAESGLLLRKQAVGYGKISLADIQAIANGMLAFASSSSGRDLTALNGHVDFVFSRIKDDPDFSQAAKILLDKAQPESNEADAGCAPTVRGK
jgi:hypothetical protein